MTPPKATLWRRGDHTEGKHLVLRHYFEAWFPILRMGRRNQRILFIDGFAGPGEYQGGEEGSPLVAMRVLSQHSSRSRIRAGVVFVFIEKDPTRAQHLEGLVAGWTDKPPNAKPFVLTGSFSSKMSQVLDQLDRQKPGVLKPMEQQGLLRVKPQTGQRNFTYPDKCRIRFLPSSQP